MSTQQFPATEVLSEIRELRALKRRRSFQRSRLARFRSELVALRHQGASYAELTAWLRQQRVKVTRSTVFRYLMTLPEMKEKREEENA